MQEIEEKAIQTYTKNREFLAQQHPSLLQKIEQFEDALEKAHRTQRYSLEYKDGYFDVLELESQKFLYAQNSNTFSQQLSDLINYSKSSYIFDGFPMFKDYEQHTEEFDDKVKGLEGIYPIMSYYLHNIPEKPQMQTIEKFIFVGLGLGLHIPLSDKKIAALEYFLIEDDIELFRLSLFTTPYYEIDATLTFSVNENKEEFTQNFKNFLSNSFFRNKYLKYLYFSAHTDEKIKLIKNALASQVFISFPYKTLLEKYTRQLTYMKLHYKFINLAQQFSPSVISDKPLLIVAAGPSFSKNLKWLEENHQNFTLLAVSAVLNKLCEKGIKPDIVTHLDGFEVSKEHLKGFNAKEFLKEALLLSGSFTPLEVLEKFSKQNVYIMEELATDYHQGFDSHTGPCVGSTSVFQAILVNFTNIYTLGLDLALDNEGRSHAASHTLTNTQYDKDKLDTLTNSISFRGDFFTVEGNFKEKVYTTPLFYSSLQSLHTAIELLKNKTQTVYNLSDGAYIKGTLPLSIQDLHTTKSLDKKLLHKELHKVFDTYATTTLSNEDIRSLQGRLAFAKNIKTKLVKYKKSPLATQKEYYLHNLISLILEILIEPTRENAALVNVYDYFLSYATPIIFDFFNTKDLQHIPKHIKNFDRLLIEEMLNICTIYEERLKSFLISTEAQ